MGTFVIIIFTIIYANDPITSKIDPVHSETEQGAEQGHNFSFLFISLDNVHTSFINNRNIHRKRFLDIKAVLRLACLYIYFVTTDLRNNVAQWLRHLTLFPVDLEICSVRPICDPTFVTLLLRPHLTRLFLYQFCFLKLFYAHLLNYNKKCNLQMSKTEFRKLN